MKLVLCHLLDLGELMQLTEQLDAVVRLDVVKPVAEHLQQSVQNAPRIALEHARQQLTCTLHSQQQPLTTTSATAAMTDSG